MTPWEKRASLCWKTPEYIVYNESKGYKHNQGKMISRQVKQKSLLAQCARLFSAGPYNPHKYKHHLVPKNMMKYLSGHIG